MLGDAGASAASAQRLGSKIEALAHGNISPLGSRDALHLRTRAQAMLAQCEVWLEPAGAPENCVSW